MADTSASLYPLSDLFKYAGYSTADPSSDPELQYFLSKGYLAPQASGGEGGSGQTLYQYANAIPDAANGAKWGTFWQPQGMTGEDHAVDPRFVVNDPNYGTITPLGNIYHESEHDAMQKATPIIEMAMSMAFGGFAAAEGFGLTGMENTAFKFAGSEIMNGGQNPFAAFMSKQPSGNQPGQPSNQSNDTTTASDGSQVNMQELQALITLLKSAFGNNGTPGS